MTQSWVIVGIFAALLFLFGYLLQLGRKNSRSDWGNSILNILDGLFRIFSRRFHRLQAELIAIPKQGGAIVAANHLSGLDPILLNAASNRPLRYVIATEQYEKPVLKWFYNAIGTIPVDRSGAPEKAFYRARQALEHGEVIVIFPQGKIRVPSEPRAPLKRGILVLAALARVPIIPVRISGVKAVGKLVSAIFFRSHAQVHVGTAISVSSSKDNQALIAIEEFITRDVYHDYPKYFDQSRLIEENQI